MFQNPELTLETQKTTRKAAHTLIDHNLRFLANNKIISKWTGVDWLVGKPVTAIFPELMGTEDTLQQLHQNPDDIFTLSPLYRRSSKTQEAFFDLQIEQAPYLDDALSLTLIQTASERRLTDPITYDNAQEHVLIQRNRNLQALNDALGSFAHRIAHNLQNPMTVLVGYTDLLRRADISLTDELQGQILQAFSRNVSKMSNMIKELMLLSSLHKETIEKRPLDMAQIVETVVSRLAFLIEDHHAHIAMPDHWPTAVGHAPWVEEVWKSYLSNAVKHGGTPPFITIGNETLKNGLIRFWVRDNGPGLSAEMSQKLTLPTHQVDQFQPTGEGLSVPVIHYAVHRLGGYITIETELEQGSLFSFTLPARK